MINLAGSVTARAAAILATASATGGGSTSPPTNVIAETGAFRPAWFPKYFSSEALTDTFLPILPGFVLSPNVDLNVVGVAGTCT